MHAGGRVTRSPDLKRNLLYVIIAEATNMGLGAMAESCGVPYDVLAWTAVCERICSNRCVALSVRKRCRPPASLKASAVNLVAVALRRYGYPNGAGDAVSRNTQQPTAPYF